MYLEHYWTFIAAAALLLALPGPTNALLLTAGAEGSLRRVLPLVLVEIVAYGLTITPLLIFSEALGGWRAIGGLALKSIALAVILLLAYRLWRRAGSISGSGALVSPKSVFSITLFNPKCLIFAFAIFPPMTGVEDAAAKAALFMLLALAAGSAWIAAGSLIASGGFVRADLIGRLSSIILCAFAIYLGSSLLTDAAALAR